MLGELTAILGQVDDEMLGTVKELLDVSYRTAATIMGSTKSETNAEIWKRVITEKIDAEKILPLLQHVKIESKAIAEGRNNFIHAVFEEVHEVKDGPPELGGSIVMRGISPRPRRLNNPDTKARKVRTGAYSDVSELPALRDRAANLSCYVAHIRLVVRELAGFERGDPERLTPWRDRLSPPLQIALQTPLPK